jgi:hypothetical protein
MGLGTGGAFSVGGRSTVGPGSGSNMGISVGNTPTQAVGVGGLGANQPNAQARQAQQGYQQVAGYNTNTANFRQPGSSSGYVPRQTPTETAKTWYGTNLGGMFGGLPFGSVL